VQHKTTPQDCFGVTYAKEYTMNASPEKMLASLKTTAEARVSDLSAAGDSLMSAADYTASTEA